MTNRAPEGTPGITIDFGEIQAVLSATHGAGRGWTDQRTLTRIAEKVYKRSNKEFGDWVDSIAESTLPHVYEYRGEASGQDIVPTVSGRLWYISQQKVSGGMSGYVKFKKSRVPAGPSPALREAFENMSGHHFPDKAEHLETEETLTARAGVQEFTTRTRSGKPTMLIFERNGRIVMQRRRIWRNEFYRRFETSFNTFFESKIVGTANDRMEWIQRPLGQQINNTITTAGLRARAKSIPKYAYPGRVTMLSAGQPYLGLYVRAGISSKVKRIVTGRLEKEMMRAWRK